MSDGEQGKDPKISQGRSPAYPYIPLGKAVERLSQLADAGATKGAFPPETFYKLWKLGAKSSGARQTMAALNHFGLLEYVGRGDSRKVKLSDLALSIVHDKIPNSPERKAAIRKAALTPQIHQDLFDQYGHFLPDDVVLETFLVRDNGYNSSAAKNVIGEYKDTLGFAGLDKPSDESDRLGENGFISGRDEVEYGGAEVGDLIQWESNGVEQFNPPRRVRVVHDTGEWLWVEESDTAIPMSEAIVIERAEAGRKPPPAPPVVPKGTGASNLRPSVPEGNKADTFTTSEGDVVLSWPLTLSSDSLEDVEAWTQLILKKVRREVERRERDKDKEEAAE